MGKLVYLKDHRHGRASTDSTGEGRGTSSGQSEPDGQLSENQCMARSSRPTVISAPDSMAESFLPSSNARELTVERPTPSSSAYLRATVSRFAMLDMTRLSVSLPEKSTAMLPGAPASCFGHPTGMKAAVVLRNIEARLRVLGISADDASRRAGKPDAIRNLRRKVRAGGQGIMTAQTLESLAQVLKTTSTALLKGAEELPPLDQDDAPRLREYLLAQRELIDRQLEALDAQEIAPVKRRAKNR